jgi:CRISPR-associated protein Csm1
VTDEIYEKYENGVCASCGKLPAENEEDELCASCYKDNVNGRRILDTESLDFDFGEGDIYLFSEKSNRVSVQLQQQRDPSSVLLNPSQDQPIADYDGFEYLNNYVPLKDSGDEDESQAIPTEELPEVGYARHHSDPEAKPSYPYLGYFKADVDRLGTLFSSGFQQGGGIIGYSTLSRLIDTFFGGYTRELQLSGEVRFGDYEVDLSKIYTVFAGGDDLMFVGAWDSVIIFGYLLYLEFRRFASFNENVTFSGGVEVTATNTPVSAASEAAEDRLETSKNSGRNRMTVLGSTFKWDQFCELFHYAQFFDRQLKRADRNESGATINNYMISRLDKYAEQAREFYSGQDPTGIIFVSRLMRDINQSIKQTDYRGNVQNEEVVGPVEHLLEDRELVQNMTFPLRWAFLQNRSKFD